MTQIDRSMQRKKFKSWIGKDISRKKEQLNMQVVFVDSKTEKCWKFIFDMNKLRLDEILLNVENQYEI